MCWCLGLGAVPRIEGVPGSQLTFGRSVSKPSGLLNNLVLIFLTPALTLARVYTGTLCRGKLVDDLGASQFSALARVLSLLNSKRDLKPLFSPSNLQAFFAEPEDYVIPLVPRLHFESLGNARAKERILSRLLTCIAAVVETCEFERANASPLP